ncbi:hypothetical protein HDV01_003477 [Terramyces sp. JEL0728]|nr:hypothetical protein HDV01_003477 [Terramyces sp. JEL0728]
MRTIRKISLLLIFITLIITISYGPFLPEKDYRVGVATNSPEIQYSQPEFKIPTEKDDFEGFQANELFPIPHDGYLYQNGPLMVKRTLAIDRKSTNIAIDLALQDSLRSIVQTAKCPSYCKFTFTNDYESIANSFDAILTDKPKGIIVHNASLHFKKAVYLPNPPSQDLLRNFSWVGTDIYVGEHSIPHKFEKELYNPPNQMWAVKGSTLDWSSLETMPCRLCERVTQQKQAVMCMVDRIEQSSTTSDANSHIKEKINGLGALEGTVDQLYINHYSKAKSRKEYMLNLMKEMQTNGVFVDDYDREVLDKDLSLCINPNKYLKPGEISLATKSFFVYYQILKQGYQNAMVIEDDAMFHYHATAETIKEAVKFVPPNYSIIQFGRGLNSVFRYDRLKLPKEGKRVITANLGDNRHCTTSYIVSKQGAILMFKSLPLHDPIDFQITGLIPHNTHSGPIKHPDFSTYSIWPAIFEPNFDLAKSGIRNKA